jgi:4-oxalmesaconate hydratase
VRGVDPETGFNYDDTKRYVDAAARSAADRTKIFETNALKVFPRLKAALEGAQIGSVNPPARATIAR